MSSPPRSRQELYERIRRSSREEVILEDMIRLGFWPARSNRPGDPADVVHRRNELQAQLRALTTEQSRLANLEAMRKELLRRRLEESRRKQQETRERRERERLARAEAWRQRKAREILFLGRGVSGGLNHREPEVDKLNRLGLPHLATAEDMARAFGLSVGQLRTLAFSRTVSTSSHYVRFLLPKKTGGHRLISAPMPRLKAAQAWILHNLLARLPAHAAVHGFLPKRSALSNALPHVGSAVVVNLDLKDFFPSVLYPRVKGLFLSLGYSEASATVLALLCTEPDTEEVELDGQRYFVSPGPRRLPQGAPSSPAITNLLCLRLDRRLAGAARKLGFCYTRYADDLTFSAQGPGPHEVGDLLRLVRRIIRKEGFTPHPDKTRVLRRGRQQEVTGVVVNDKPGVDRKTLRRFRALLHQVDTRGPDGAHWGPGKDVLTSAVGFASYVAMVDPAKGKPLLDKARELLSRHGAKKARTPPPAPASPADNSGPAASPAAEPKNEPTPPGSKKWWKRY